MIESLIEAFPGSAVEENRRQRSGGVMGRRTQQLLCMESAGREQGPRLQSKEENLSSKEENFNNRNCETKYIFSLEF